MTPSPFMTYAVVLFQFQIKAPSTLARLQLLNILIVCLRRLNPRSLDGISNLKLELNNLVERILDNSFSPKFQKFRDNLPYILFREDALDRNPV